MSKRTLVAFVICILLGVVGCTTGGFVDRSDAVDQEGNFYVEVEIPPSFRSGSVTAQGMVELVQMKFRVTKKDDPTQQLTRTVTIGPEDTSVIAAFRLSRGDWYLEVIGLNDRDKVIFRDEDSLAYWRARRSSNSWTPYESNAFPEFVENERFGTGVDLNLETVTITSGAIVSSDSVVLELERCYALVLVSVDEGWSIIEPSSIVFSQPGRPVDYDYWGSTSGGLFVFRNNVVFRHLPMGGWQITAVLKVENDDDPTDTRDLTATAFVELYAGQLTTIQFSGGNENLVIGDTN